MMKSLSWFAFVMFFRFQILWTGAFHVIK